LLDRQVGRALAVENAINVKCGTTVLKPNCWVLLHQFAGCRDGEAVLFGRP